MRRRTTGSCLPDVASTGAECLHEPLPGALGSGRWPAPEKQGDCEENHGQGVEGEDHRNPAQVGNDQSGQCRSDRAGQVDVDQIHPGRRPQLRPRDQLGDDRSPGGLLHGDAGTQGKREGQQQGGGHLSRGGEDREQDADDQEVGLDGEQQPASVEGVGQDSASQRQQHHG